MDYKITESQKINLCNFTIELCVFGGNDKMKR